MRRCGAMRNMIKHGVRNAVMLAGIALALPVSCNKQPTDGLYTGNVQPSPAGRVNPEIPGFVNGPPSR